MNRRLPGQCTAGVAAGVGMVALTASAGYPGLVTGALQPDLSLGRRVRPLGPQTVDIAAPPHPTVNSVPATGRRTNRWPGTHHGGGTSHCRRLSAPAATIWLES